ATPAAAPAGGSSAAYPSTAAPDYDEDRGDYVGISLDPSVSGRLQAFDDAIHKMLWPAERKHHSIWKTRRVLTEEGTTDGWTDLNVYTTSLPERLPMFLGDGSTPRTLRTVLGLDQLISDGRIQLGPIPRGTPVNLLANINIDRNDSRFSIIKLLRLVNDAKHKLKELRADAKDDARRVEIL